MKISRTVRQLIDALHNCETDRDADKLLRQEVAAMLYDNGALMEDRARKAMREHIAYLAAYFSRDEAKRIYALFHLVHPVYGKAEDWPEDVDELFATAMRAARQDAVNFFKEM